MTSLGIHFARSASHTVREADRADPIPPAGLTIFADVAIRGAIALMPFSAIAWVFMAH